jgi:hypothetical protein
MTQLFIRVYKTPENGNRDLPYNCNRQNAAGLYCITLNYNELIAKSTDTKHGVCHPQKKNATHTPCGPVALQDMP